MVQKIVDALVNKQSQNYVMTDEDEKIYRYGYVLLCEVFLNLVIALAIGIVFSKTKEVIFFLVKPNDVRGYRLKAISDFLPEDIQTVSKMAIRGKTGYIPVEAEVMEQIDRALIRQLNLIRAARNMVMEELSDGSEN